MTDFISQFRSARRVGTPLVKIDTPDPAQTIEQLLNSAIAEASPVIRWDCVQGYLPANKAGTEAIKELVRQLQEQAGGPVDLQAVTSQPFDCMVVARMLPERTVLFAINAHRYVADGTASGAAYVQAIWNLRDLFKSTTRTLVLLGPSMVLPPELGGDVLPLDEPLPNEAELTAIVEGIVDEAKVACDKDTVAKAVDALRGLPAFSAEQATALAVEKRDGVVRLDVGATWERKRQMIAATPGLSVYMGGETFDDIGGNAQVKGYLARIMEGRESPRVVVFIDEIEKAMAGAGGGGGPGDSSGVSQGMHGQLLTYMQDNKVEGVLELGPPGAGKSAVGKALAATFSRPMIVLDLGGMKASLVGESEARLRTALKVITAVGGGRALFIATCNRIQTLSPELRRRFPRVFFFDLPDASERDAIWRLYAGKYDLGDQQRPEDAGWTGAEIEQAARLAWRLEIPLVETAQYIVPVAKSARAEIEDLRKQADQNFLSAAKPGPYVLADSKPYEVTLPGKRPRKFGSAGLN